LLDFENIPAETLDIIWRELGRAKASNEEKDDYGSYSVSSVCIRFFSSGQTLAFDSKASAYNIK
jgi:hypothetical protein